MFFVIALVLSLRWRIRHPEEATRAAGPLIPSAGIFFGTDHRVAHFGQMMPRPTNPERTLAGLTASRLSAATARLRF
ncbi:MAG: hypothetical protein ACLGHK_10470, partial [Alphaproteobacteria bacterium]